MEKQISIIVPTYNMEKYLNKCLDSLLIPELDEVEVLVINDGSTDRSSEIAHEYEKRYPESFRVIDKKNGNYGSCINTALPLVSGRYVKVLDADDHFETQAFSQFVKFLRTCNEDVVVSGMVIIDENNNEKEDHLWGNSLRAEQSYQFSDVKDIIFGMVMHGISYKASLFNTFNYKQTEGRSFTDNEWVIKPITHAHSFRFSKVPKLYRYLVGRSGQTGDAERLIKLMPDHLKMLENIREYYLNFEGEECRKEYIYKMILNHHRIIYGKALKIKKTNPKILLMIKEYDLELKFSNPKMFEAIGEFNLLASLKYKYIKKFRDSNYNSNFKIPSVIFLMKNIIVSIAKVKSQLKG